MPYELDDKLSNGITADEVIVDLVLENISKPFYYASTDSDKCCVIECQTLNEDILYTPYHTHINTPFILFDDMADFFVLVDYDLPFQVIGYKNIHDSHEYITNQIGQEGWDTVLKRYAHYTNMPNLLNTYYRNVLPKTFRELLTEKLKNP